METEVRSLSNMMTRSVIARDTGDKHTISYVFCGEAGRGSFGVVNKIRLLSDGQVYALKRTEQDTRFKVRHYWKVVLCSFADPHLWGTEQRAAVDAGCRTPLHH